MKLISHRGNVFGKVSELENKPEYILKAIDLGFDVEIDVWDIFGSYFLGHEKPQYLVKLNFLKNEHLWCHLKNIEAVCSLTNAKDTHWFWHETDKVVLSSKGYKIAVIGTVIPNTIINQPNNDDFMFNGITYQGILADNIEEYRLKLIGK